MKFSLPYIVNIKNIVSMKKLSKFFRTFSSPVERGCDNRPYLVKWLKFIHNSLICNYKVTKNLALDQILLTLILLEINNMDMFYSINF